MARLIFSGITSLDGYVVDEQGKFDWSEPDEEVHSYINDLERPVSTYLYGRRMYEVMSSWESVDLHSDFPEYILDFAALWRAADKIVFSTTLDTPRTERTRIEPHFTPDIVRALKESASGDISVGGPTLAAHALRAGLVDECHLFVTPISVGGGIPLLPRALRLRFRLLDVHRFRNGVVHLRYNTAL